MVVTVFAGCKKADEETDAPTQGSEETPTETQEQQADEYKPSAAQLLNGKEWGKDFTELYDEIGDKLTIDDRAGGSDHRSGLRRVRRQDL